MRASTIAGACSGAPLARSGSARATSGLFLVVQRGSDHRVDGISELRLRVGHPQPPEGVHLAFELAAHADVELADPCCEVAVDSVVVGVPKENVVRSYPLEEP